MCGIAGALALDGGAPAPALVRAMAAAIAHRGPDGEGFFEDGPVALGHRRLSILDLSPAGAQPMADASGRWVVTYNGEIYNYLELRADLEADGVEFRSRSDTEVLLEGWARWGEGVLRRLNGMFAFVLWDRKERRLFAARDRFGEKPLFYRHEPGRGFWFASEPKAIFAAGVMAARPRRDLLFRFLAYQQTGTRDDSFYEGLSQVPPAHALTLADGRLTVAPYWSLPERPEPPAGDEAAQVAGIRELLEDSVRIRMRSDVPLGTCLSGGMDSSSIVALVSGFLREGAAGATGATGATGAAGAPPQETFTAAFPGSPSDETRFVDEVVRATGVASHRVEPTAAGLLADLPRLLDAQEEPFSGPTIYAEWKVMELAKEHGVTVLLNVHGRDEVFAGYPHCFGDLWWSLLAAGRVGEARREMAAYAALHGRGTARGILAPEIRARAPRWLRRLKGGPDLPHLDAGFVRAEERAHPPRPAGLRWGLRDAQSFRMLPHLLRQADRSSMAFSREARLPILDHRLVEAVDALPDRMKLRGGVSKWVLREAARGLLPESIRDRHDKVGFGLPTERWLREGCMEAVHDTFASRSFRERGFFDTDGARAAADRLAAGDGSAVAAVWNSFLGEQWLRRCVDGR